MLASSAAYAVAFPPLFREIGDAVGAFGIFPPLLAGALLGSLAGGAWAFAMVGLNAALFFQAAGTTRGVFVAGLAAAVFGAIVGRLRDMDAKLREEHAEQLEALERARAAHALLVEREAQLVLTHELTKVGSWELDIRTRELKWSRELYTMFGVSLDSPRPTYDTFLTLVHAPDRARVSDAVELAVKTGGAFNEEFRAVHADGTIRYLHGRGIVSVDERGAPLKLVGAAQDVTEQRDLHARLVAADRAASLGTLASGVAHEINNPLAYVAANLTYLGRELTALRESTATADWTELEGALAEAREGADRVRRIVQDLKTFSRSDEDASGPVDLRAALEFSLKMTRNEIRHHARLVEHCGEVPLVDADEGRLGQVFVNLLVNAAQAIPEGRADENEIRVSTWTDPAGNAVVEISDTGAGIPPELRDRIFDPFFTTKPVGIGTGLGLSICRGIVTKFGGELSLQSEVNRGTCFRVTLRPAQAAGAPSPSVSAPPEDLSQILIVDDDALVTSSLRRLLASGHDVEVASSVDVALQRMATKRFDLILCDLMMPDLTGMDLHERVLRDHADQAKGLVFMSAGVFTSRAREFVAARPECVLEKPLDLDRLLALVRERMRPAMLPKPERLLKVLKAA